MANVCNRRAPVGLVKDLQRIRLLPLPCHKPPLGLCDPQSSIIRQTNAGIAAGRGEPPAPPMGRVAEMALIFRNQFEMMALYLHLSSYASLSDNFAIPSSSSFSLPVFTGISLNGTTIRQLSDKFDPNLNLS
jgi:hypothetical protein